jgi:hypothetical protein
MALGGVVALALLCSAGLGGVYAYRYLTEDHDRLALVEDIRLACRNGRGVYRAPTPGTHPLVALQRIEAQREGIHDCGVARLRLVAYDNGLEFDAQ